MDLISRQAALARGLSRYFTGRPCSRGHVDHRLVSNCGCLTCHRAAYVARFPTGSPARAARGAVYYAKNRAQENARSRQWRSENIEYARQRVREWLAENGERRNTLRRNYVARERNAEGTHTAEDVAALYVRQGAVCAACPTDLSDGYHVDHKQPLTRGGSNWSTNLQLLCGPCNMSKGAKTMEEWGRRIARTA
jgi:5-methylcytosine-specific restriction endonuclease McrA